MSALSISNVITVQTAVSVWFFFFQAEDGIRDLVRSRGLGDVYKRQLVNRSYSGRPVSLSKMATASMGRGLITMTVTTTILSLIHI